MSRTKIDPDVRTMLFDMAQHSSKHHLFRCAGCRKFFVRTALQVDHRIPEAESTPEQRSDPANLQLLCAPRGSTRWTSCHKKKTAAEHARRAHLNRPPKDWGPFWRRAACSAVVIPATWQYIDGGDQAAIDWVVGCLLAEGTLFSTYLVQKGWRLRRPRSVNRPAPEPVVGPGRGAAPETLDADRISGAFREVAGPKGKVVVETQGMDHFTISYVGTEFPDHQDDKRYEVLAKIQAKIEGRWRPVWNTQDDLVTFSRRPVLERMVRHPGFDQKRPWNVLPIAPGVNLDLLVTTHVLIIGTTGAGKTALMRTTIVAVADSARRDDSMRTILADPKLIEMPGFNGWSGIREVVSETEDLWQMAFDLEAEMWERLRLIRGKKAKTSDFRKILCVIDEYEQYFKRMDTHWRTAKDEEGKPLKQPGQRVCPAISAIQTVLSMARRVNIHLIIGTQSPDATWFGGTGTRENLSGRVAVGPVDAFRARMMFDDSSIGRDIPIEFKGRATVQVGDGEAQEVQCYYTPDPFDPDDNNTAEDWDHLVRLGMPKEMVPT